VSTATIYRTVVGCVPDSELSPNARVHRMVRARKQKQLRELVGWTARDDRPALPLAGDVIVTVTIGWPKRRPGMDIDNATACLKGAIDGLVDAGFIRDDKQITELRVRQRKWSEWKDSGGWLHEHGCMAFDIEEVSNG
jgi:Holliday junction resolvase RusA-like endonuclease